MKLNKVQLLAFFILCLSGCSSAAVVSTGANTSPSAAAVFKEVAGYYDYVYLHPKDLFNHSSLVVSGEFTSESRSMVVNEQGEPSVVTYFDFIIDKVVKGTYDGKEIEVFAAGGTTTVAEYMSKAPETQWAAAGLTNVGSKVAPSFQKDSQIVDQQLIKYSLKDQFIPESGKKYLLFLGLQDTKEYRILGDRWGALVIHNDSVTDALDHTIIKIPELSK